VHPHGDIVEAAVTAESLELGRIVRREHRVCEAYGVRPDVTRKAVLDTSKNAFGCGVITRSRPPGVQSALTALQRSLLDHSDRHRPGR
jgi:hypothetical protein